MFKLNQTDRIGCHKKYFSHRVTKPIKLVNWNNWLILGHHNIIRPHNLTTNYHGQDGITEHISQ